MDSITHIVLGACIGEAVAGRQLHKRSMFYGALAQSVPDVDFVLGFFLHGADNVVAHRGITHSILFGVVAVLFLTWLVKNVIHKTPLPLKNVLLLFAVNIFVHLFIDTFNAYGVGLLMPFSRHRFTFNVLYVADPLFSIAPFISFLFLLFLHKSHKRRVMWIRTGIFVSAIYLCIAIVNKIIVDNAVQRNLSAQNKSTDFFTTPSPFNSLLWFVAAKEKNGYYTAYRSVFDKDTMRFTFFPRNETLTDTVGNQKDLHSLKDFAQGYYTFERWGDTTVLNVLRFGQEVGWYNPTDRFCFHYYLNFPAQNDLVVQRGRFEHWTKESLNAFFRRMFGAATSR
ncbi:metal-dependent hydrolase [Flavisolibacter ginsenosidimutans]|uniref:Metal-dependent hydrolase n=1 Tax=Flavisolibacter ginsenosidimutans TaxID=661481 RepID=A0A5B8UK62_9BACT|nr:metal-dependent hydrolase [Flavisolibacter ginsenosidimutans]QEC56405.1 metal-dependent hydrolase [Flavisolibacter ginsenosidimutans]